MASSVNIALICAMAQNRVIGRDGRLPWHLPEDLKHFKRTTMGHPIIMGRKTWQSIARPLPGRRNIVISRNPSFSQEVPEEVQVVSSLQEALQLCETSDQDSEAFIIGGAKLYEAAFPLAKHFHLTKIHAEVEGDTVLTGFNESEWQEITRQDYAPDDNNPYPYSICHMERRGGTQ